ncbi:hypothetical protein ACIBF1_04445 [Spirillospora sp. NPDC050679]
MPYNSMSFLAAYDELMSEGARARFKGPSSLLDAWRSLVEECEDGYSFGVDEFSNDVRVRDLIEKLCMDPRVLGDPAREEYLQRVQEVDARFKVLLQSAAIGSPDLPWWRRAVLSRAGEEYADGMRSQYGICVESPRPAS